MKLKNIPKKSRRLRLTLTNLEKLAKDWEEDLAKGKKHEETVYNYLISKGYQVMPIIPHNPEREKEKFTKQEKIERAKKTIFNPDFLVATETEVFFADSKGKTFLRSLGIVNVRDYDKYLRVMKNVKGLGFRIYFPIKETNEIYIHDKLRNPKAKPPYEIVPFSDGNTYRIPRSELVKVN